MSSMFLFPAFRDDLPELPDVPELFPRGLQFGLELLRPADGPPEHDSARFSRDVAAARAFDRFDQAGYCRRVVETAQYILQSCRPSEHVAHAPGVVERCKKRGGVAQLLDGNAQAVQFGRRQFLESAATLSYPRVATLQ